MAAFVDIHEAETNLPELLLRVIAGEKIVITKAGKPLAMLVPFEQKKIVRKPGSARGRIQVAPDFNAPLPNEFIDAFEGKFRA